VKLVLWVFTKDYFESMVVIVMLCIIVSCLSDLFVQLVGLSLELGPDSCTVQGSIACQRVLSKYSR
jgi:hypothetical protein